jgi:hypothetical protein
MFTIMRNYNNKPSGASPKMCRIFDPRRDSFFCYLLGKEICLVMPYLSYSIIGKELVSARISTRR